MSTPYKNIAKVVRKTAERLAAKITIGGAQYLCFASDAEVRREIEEDGGVKVSRVLQTDLFQADFAAPPAAGTRCTFNGIEYRIPQGVEAESIGVVYRVMWEAV